ncbi:MAG: alpha/beta hydrolase [Desulfarculus sp.]|nr:MAG: alpha/beta hydrolase [Desulfarculus sp.]
MATEAPGQEQAIAGAGGTRLYTWRLPAPQPKAAAVILHGYGEHSGRHAELARALAGLGLSCYLLDLRGHGRSGGPRGAILSWEEYLRDLDLFLAQVAAWQGGPPALLLGHSLGGLLAASYVLERPHPFRLLALSSPLFAVGQDVSGLKQMAGRLLSRWLPRVSLPTEIQPEMLSHDPEVGRAYMADPLVHRVGNVRWFSETLAARDRCLARAHELTVQGLLVLYGQDDALVDPAGTRDFCGRVRLADLTCRGYPGMYHEVFNELGREQVLAELSAWLGERL